MKSNERGFTLIELVMVIVILAILGAVAIPQFVNLRGEAQLANEAGVAGGVRAGILTFFIDPARGNRTNYPAALDAIAAPAAGQTACSTAAPCFTTVLAQGGITEQWAKIPTQAGATASYRSPASTTNVWNYTAANGNFVKTVN